MFCSQCGAQTPDGSPFCASCGQPTGAAQSAPGPSPDAAQTPPAIAQPPTAQPLPPPPQAAAAAPKSKMVAALLGIFVGAFGVHRFYLGYNPIGIAQLVLGVLGFVTCGITTLASAVWGLVEGIMILTGKINKDAAGQPLVE